MDSWDQGKSLGTSLHMTIRGIAHRIAFAPCQTMLAWGIVVMFSTERRSLKATMDRLKHSAIVLTKFENMTRFNNRQRFNYRQLSPKQRYLVAILEIC